MNPRDELSPGRLVASVACALLCAVVLVLTVSYTHPNTTRPTDYLLGSAPLLLPIVLSLGWAALWPAASRSEGVQGLKRANIAYAVLALVFAGLAWGLVGLKLFNSWISELPFLWAIFAIPGAVLAVTIAILSPTKAAAPAGVRFHRLALLVIPPVALGSLFIWSFSYPFTVISQTERLSAGRPYCLGVFELGRKGQSNHYRSANLYDLTGLTLDIDAIPDTNLTEHMGGEIALLQVKQPDGMHFWSWTRYGAWGRFNSADPPDRVAKALGLPVYDEPSFEIAGCKLRPHAGRSLPLF